MEEFPDMRLQRLAAGLGHAGARIPMEGGMAAPAMAASDPFWWARQGIPMECPLHFRLGPPS
jgi:hypothetical protein